MSVVSPQVRNYAIAFALGFLASLLAAHVYAKAIKGPEAAR